MECQELKDLICERIAKGETIRQLEREEGMPSRTTVWRWQLDDPSFDEDITRAQRQAGATLADEALELARDTSNENYGARRVTIDTLKWAASKFYPKMFGDHAQTNVNVAVDARTVVVTEDKRKELQAKLKAIQDAT